MSGGNVPLLGRVARMIWGIMEGGTAATEAVAVVVTWMAEEAPLKCCSVAAHSVSMDFEISQTSISPWIFGISESKYSYGCKKRHRCEVAMSIQSFGCFFS